MPMHGIDPPEERVEFDGRPMPQSYHPRNVALRYGDESTG